MTSSQPSSAGCGANARVRQPWKRKAPARAWLVAAIVLLTNANVHAGEGRVCIAAVDPVLASKADHDYPGGKAPREYAYKFTVHLDSRKPVEVSEDGSVLIAEIATGEKHKLVIRDAGKIIESFSFTFERRGSTHLCLAYGPWYQSWHLEPPQPGWRWCRCDPPSADKVEKSGA